MVDIETITQILAAAQTHILLLRVERIEAKLDMLLKHNGLEYVEVKQDAPLSDMQQNNPDST
jgi:hypothetical protein